MRKLRTSPPNEGEGVQGQNVLENVFDITAKDAIQTDLDGKRVYNSRVGAPVMGMLVMSIR